MGCFLSLHEKRTQNLYTKIGTRHVLLWLISFSNKFIPLAFMHLYYPIQCGSITVMPAVITQLNKNFFFSFCVRSFNDFIVYQVR